MKPIIHTTHYPGFGYGFSVDTDSERYMSQQHYLTRWRAKRAAKKHVRHLRQQQRKETWK